MAAAAGPDVYGMAKGATEGLMAKGRAMLDSLFPPEQRQQLLEWVQTFATQNPKLSAFLLANVTLTGLPLLLFIVFSITVFIFSLVAALLIAVVAALLFTVFCIIVALVIVLPTIFITTLGATFLFLWGLGGYYILSWFNSANPAKPGEALGDKLNSLTGGRMDWLMQSVRNPPDPVPTKVHGEGTSEEKEPLVNGHKTENASGPPKLATRNADAGKATGAATEAVNGVKSRAGGATGTATGLTSIAKGQANGVAG